MRLGVVGLGLIGGSVLRALGGVGFDVDASVRAAAARDGFAVVDSLGGLAGCDLVVVAVPPRRTAEVVAAVLDAVPGAVVADTASVKEVVVGAVAADADRFVGAHPLAGAETSGWAAGSADLLAGAVWAVCPGALEPVLRLGDAVDALGGRMVACTAAEHDAAVARTSHVPHLLSQALAGFAAGPLSGTAFRDMTRVAAADVDLWEEILTLNRGHVGEALDELEARLGALRAALESGELRSAWRRPAPPAVPAWREQRVEGGWSGLLALGRPFRRLRREGDQLVAEVDCRVAAPQRKEVDGQR